MNSLVSKKFSIHLNTLILKMIVDLLISNFFDYLDELLFFFKSFKSFALLMCVMQIIIHYFAFAWMIFSYSLMMAKASWISQYYLFSSKFVDSTFSLPVNELSNCSLISPFSVFSFW